MFCFLNERTNKLNGWFHVTLLLRLLSRYLIYVHTAGLNVQLKFFTDIHLFCVAVHIIQPPSDAGVNSLRFRWKHDLTVMTRFSWVSLQGATVAAVFAAVLTTALPVNVHILWDFRDPFHQGATEALLGIAFLLEVRVVGEHLLTLVDLQLGV